MSNPTLFAFKLICMLELRHYICDFLLQNEYMLGKFKKGWKWVLPLLAHSFVYGLGTLIVLLIMAPSMWWLSILDMGFHFCVDRIKANPDLLGRYNNKEEKPFWNILGLDQLTHQLLSLCLALWVVKSLFPF